MLEIFDFALDILSLFSTQIHLITLGIIQCVASIWYKLDNSQI